jgi:hypothetical protein
MCCGITILLLLGPRAAILIWWLFRPLRFAATFPNFVWPLLGFLFLPWTTLAYLIVWRPEAGVVGFGWFLLIFAFLADLFAHAGGAYGNRDRIRAYR